MGYFSITHNGADVDMTPELLQEITDKTEKNIKNLTIDGANSSFVSLIVGLSDFTMTVDGKTYKVSYSPGRKDYSLNNMFQEGYIQEVQLKNAFVE